MTTSMINHALDVVELTKTYGEGRMAVTAVDSATFHVGRHKFSALLGPSGSGKTTLVSMVGGLLTPTGGSVKVAGADLGDMPKKEQTRLRANHIGFVFQSYNLVPFLTARKNLTVMASIADAPRKEIDARADQLLEELGLTKRCSDLPEQLSGGERQRVAIGRWSPTPISSWWTSRPRRWTPSWEWPWSTCWPTRSVSAERPGSWSPTTCGWWTSPTGP